MADVPTMTGEAHRQAMKSFDQLWVWDDPAIAESLGWYLDVAENRMPAKFRLARTVPVAITVDQATEEALWGSSTG